MSTAKRRKLKKAVIGWLCIAALTANMTMPGAPLHEFTQITANAEVENVTPVNLSEIEEGSPVDGITVALKSHDVVYTPTNYYEIQITKDGNYAFKGSNYINNSYVDIQFVVADGITANLYFDDVYIKNDDGFFLSSGSFLCFCINPFNIGSSSTADLSGKLCIDTCSYFNDNTQLFRKSDLKTGEGTLTGLHTVTYTNESGNQFEEIYCTSGADAKLPEGYECFTVADKAFDGKNVTESVTVKAFENHSFDTNGFCEICGGYEPATLTTAKYDIDGDENIDEVYEIGNAGQLYWFAGLVNGTLTDGTSQNTAANGVLTADITVNKGENTNDVANCNGTKADDWKDWTPIGNDSNMYTGTFNGINHTVSGLYFNDEDTCAVGLFGCLGNTKDEEGKVTSYAKISSISVSDSYIKGYSAVGGISGYNHYGFIINCNYKGTVIGNEYTGGVCGYNNIGLMIYCYNRGTVSGGEYIGGVCGGNNYVILNCCNRGEVSGEDSVGGVCGGNNTKITNCYNIGKVTATASVSDASVGGVGGYNHGIVANCYYNSDVYSGKAVGVNDNTVSENVLGKTTDQFTSGEVAYLLSQGCTVGEGEEASTYDGSVWGQTLTGDNKQDYPVLGGKMVLTNIDQSEFANDVMIYGQNVVLDGTIGFNIYVAADDAYEWSAKIDGKEVPKPEKDENGIYKFTCNVAAKDMSNNIEFYINDNVKATVSVKSYLEDLKANSGSETSTPETEKIVDLANAMETYGNAANAFFNNGTVAAPTEEVTAENLSGYSFTKNETFPAGISYYGSSLLLKSETTVRHYFKLEEGQDITNFAFTVKVGNADYSTVTPVEKQGYYYIDIENISADQLDTPHTVKIGDVEVISNYSAMSYANSVLSSETADDNLKNLVKTLYLYNQKANALSGVQSSN